MLQAHSLLWHYLFVAPNVLLFALAIIAYGRGLQREVPAFLVFAIATAVTQLIIYAADVSPSVAPTTWWKMFWAGLMIEALLKFVVIGEIFDSLFGRYASVAKVGKWIISAVGVILVLLAVTAAAYTPKNNVYWIVSGAHVLEQTIYLIECGLILSLFILAAYFRLTWRRIFFGIAFGLGISACVHLAIWALAANGAVSARYRVFFDFPIMATYHASVLIWYYYLLVPEKKVSKPKDIRPPEHNLEVWNQELERLIHQ